ncbi:hypothetical protein VB796_10220 [Arcicella sp. LKC2W]|uniref:CdiA C-terminal domain-containing protein n=1 Tax=Arcicella sp. LKC2W TaxID=2984198 RepID=UPI002B1F20E8|nr:hypothetical protein [Arcicella sp. LKC2W]MEA5459416.1 hypothetical protein [Arcicella sp. LKC2W]
MNDYLKVYPSNEIGEDTPINGYVEVHNTHLGEERNKNIETAIFLAKKGFQVRLLEVINQPNHKNPDAYIVNKDIIIEFKHNVKATKSAIDNEIRDAKNQADYILIDIQSDISREDLLEGIKNRYRRPQPKYQTMKDLWLIWKGELYIFTREEVITGAINHKIQ